MSWRSTQIGQDVAKVKIPTPGTCAECHPDRVKQFKAGKHAAAWAAMKAMPTAPLAAMALMEGMKGCGGCHKIGLKSEAEIKELKKTGPGFGLASCDACHTRHTFSVQEAKHPSLSDLPHGFDHPQWEMYSGSKHGVRYLLKPKQDAPSNCCGPTARPAHARRES